MGKNASDKPQGIWAAGFSLQWVKAKEGAKCARLSNSRGIDNQLLSALQVALEEIVGDKLAGIRRKRETAIDVTIIGTKASAGKMLEEVAAMLLNQKVLQQTAA